MFDAKDRDERRGYSIDKKRVVIAYTAELVIVTASLWGAWLLANMYGHNDIHQIEMMMLAPIGYAVIEFCRVPLAISARAHASRFVKLVALIGVVCASGVTVKSMSQLGEIMFRPRLFDVVHSKEELQRAQAGQATIVQQIAAADAQVASQRAALAEIEQRAKSDATQLAALPKDQCAQTGGVTKDGRAWRGQTCKSDPRILPLRDNLKTTVEARDDAAKLVDQAVAARDKLDRTDVDHTVSVAQVNYREALLHSQLHSFTSMVFGISPTEVTDAQISQFLRIFVFFPAVFVAFASSFVAFTAVNHIKIDPAYIPFDPEGTEYLLNPIYQSVLNEAIDRVEARQKAAAIKVGEVV
jgi:hypothetical protein